MTNLDVINVGSDRGVAQGAGGRWPVRLMSMSPADQLMLLMIDDLPPEIDVVAAHHRVMSGHGGDADAALAAWLDMSRQAHGATA